MIEGAPYSYWIAFHVLVLVLLVADLFLLQGKNHQLSVKVAWAWTGFLAVLAGLFAVWILYSQGRQPSLEFVSGYLIETSLSVDNLFVFLLLFRSFSLKPADQHRGRHLRRSALGHCRQPWPRACGVDGPAQRQKRHVLRSFCKPQSGVREERSGQ